MTEFKELDTVRVLAFPSSVDPMSACAPGLGDRGAVAHVLGDSKDRRYAVESIDSTGRMLWLAEFSANALAPTKSEASTSLTFHAMASGQLYLLLGRQFSWQTFLRDAPQLVDRLKARVVEKTQGPSEQIWTLLIDAQKFWLSWEDFGGEVALEPCDPAAGLLMPELWWRLSKSRAPVDVAFSILSECDGARRLRTGCPELDFLLSDELRDGGDVSDTIDESLTLELSQQIQDIRAGRTRIVRNGSDAMFIQLSIDGVLLEYAVPGAPRPGPTVTLHSFVDVFVHWFERVNPLLGMRVRNIVWPRSFD